LNLHSYKPSNAIDDVPKPRSRLARHLYALALAALIGGVSLGVFMAIYYYLSRAIGDVYADLVALAASIVALFAMMLLAYEITKELVKRDLL
jgi:Zn-dependent protease